MGSVSGREQGHAGLWGSVRFKDVKEALENLGLTNTVSKLFSVKGQQINILDFES